MSNPGTPNPIATLVITGNPTLDTIIRYGLMAIFMGITGYITAWLKMHGYDDPGLNLAIAGALASTLAAVAVAAWGVIRSSNIGKIIAVKETAAVQAGMAAQAGSGAPVAPPVTHEDAKAIIATFAPPVVAP